MIRLFLFTYCICTFPQFVFTQVDSTSTLDTRIEDLLQTGIESADLDHNLVFENLDAYRNNPLNLNTAERADLEELRLLSDLQIDRFLNYRAEYGKLLAIYELQVVPGFDLETIRLIQPFITAGSDIDDFQEPLAKMIFQGDNSLFLRWTTTLETLDGEINPDTSRQFLGDPNRYYLRYRHNYENRLYYGITAEKDPGEALGLDYYSAHFYLRNYRSWLPDLALGDFRVSFGQGLIAYSGFSYGKSADAVRVLRPARPLGPYASVNEFDFFRGAAIRLRPMNKLDVTLFASLNNLDARLADTSFQSDAVSSIVLTGFHRTAGEAALKGNAKVFDMGGSIKWKWNKGHIAYNIIRSSLNAPLEARNPLYGQFVFAGTDLLNMSIDYDWQWRGLHGFGEFAVDGNGALASTNGLLAAISRDLDFALLYRNFAYNFQTIHGNAFGETRATQNENGIYTGLTWRPEKGWLFNAYYDIYKHNWLRFLVDAPSRGSDWLIRIERFKKRTWRIYFQIRGEEKEFNVPNNETKTDLVREGRWFNSRLHFEYKVLPALELRSRIGWNTFSPSVGAQTQGWMLYQDVIFRPKSLPISFTARYAIFETEDYNTRFYNYENDVLYVFSIPAYYDRGTRFYINSRLKLKNKMTLELRFARLFLPRRETLGTGPYLIRGSSRSELKAQFSWRF